MTTDINGVSRLLGNFRNSRWYGYIVRRNHLDQLELQGHWYNDVPTGYWHCTAVIGNPRICIQKIYKTDRRSYDTFGETIQIKK